MKKKHTFKAQEDGFELEDLDFADEDEYEGEEEYEEAYEDDDEYEAAPDKRLLMLMAAAGIVILIIGIVIFAGMIKKNHEEKTAVSENLEALFEDTAEKISEEEPYAEAEATDLKEEENREEEQQKPEESTEQLQIQMGALDDTQDPQTSGTSGNEAETGAQVTVAPISPDEVKGVTQGIDVSKYQGTIDWSKVKESGVEFAMVRVGYRAKSTGEIFEDPTARYNMQEAQAVGIKLGAYFFSSAITPEEARQEAVFTKEIIAKYKITYPVAYNCEDFQSPDSRQNGLDSAARTSLAIAFLDEIAAGGYTPMFYASKSEMEGNALWDATTLSSKYKIWVAQYPEAPYPQTAASSYSGTHDMWQYTSQGTVAGISKKTDVNLAYFGYSKEAEAKDETPAEQVEANPEVGIIFTEVNETVTAKQETNLRSEPSTLNDGSIVGKLVHGDTATRTGIGHNGWSRIIYNGQTLYAVTNYLTTDMNDTGAPAPPQGPVYTPVNEQVTAKDETNLRSQPSTASEDTIVGKLYHGEVLTRTGIGDNGWSQLDYNGQTVYAVSSYLTTP